MDKRHDSNDFECDNQSATLDLFDLWDIIWLKKKFLFITTLIVSILVTFFLLTIPNKYKAELLMVPISDNRGSGISAALGGLGSLASLAGVSVGGSGSLNQDLAVLKSREFLWGFIRENKLMPILFSGKWDLKNNKWDVSKFKSQPTLWDAYRLFIDRGVLSSHINKKTGLVTIAIEWSDPKLAAKWTNELVVRLNSHLRSRAIERSKNNLMYLNLELKKNSVAEMRQTLFDLISKEQKSAMLANTQKEFAFRVIDRAITPDKKSKPARTLILIVSMLVTIFLSILIVIIQQAIINRRQSSSTA